MLVEKLQNIANGNVRDYIGRAILMDCKRQYFIEGMSLQIGKCKSI